MRTSAGWLASLVVILSLGVADLAGQQPAQPGPTAAQTATPAQPAPGQPANPGQDTTTAWVIGILSTILILVVVCAPMRRS